MTVKKITAKKFCCTTTFTAAPPVMWVYIYSLSSKKNRADDFGI
jgi:hypothetical protein